MKYLIVFITVTLILLGKHQPTVRAEAADAADIDFGQLHGVNFSDRILTAKQNQNQNYGSVTDTNLQRSLQLIKAYGFNVIRVNYYWEAYEVDPVRFLDEAELVASAASKNDLYVIYTFSQWYTSSYFEKKASGFPYFLLTKYVQDGGELESKNFWDDLYDNAINYNGSTAWDLQADFMSKVINRVDKYDNVIGYELLNEPHIYDNSQFEKLGKYHTYIAEKLRKITEKAILFDRATITYAGSTITERLYEFERLLAPSGITNIVFAPHLYSAPQQGSWAEKTVGKFESLAQEWGNIPVFMGEWAADTKDDMRAFLGTFKEKKFGWTYFSWNSSSEDPKRLIDQNFKPTAYLVYLLDTYRDLLHNSPGMGDGDKKEDLPSLDSFIMSEPMILNKDNETGSEVAIGPTVILNEISNISNRAHGYVVLVLVQDAEGITVDLFSAHGQLANKEQTKTRFVWVPETRGSYVINAFVWTNIQNPEALSPLKSTTVQIT